MQTMKPSSTPKKTGELIYALRSGGNIFLSGKTELRSYEEQAWYIWIWKLVYDQRIVKSKRLTHWMPIFEIIPLMCSFFFSPFPKPFNWFFFNILMAVKWAVLNFLFSNVPALVPVFKQLSVLILVTQIQKDSKWGNEEVVFFFKFLIKLWNSCHF